jgi:hypothetical protein
VLVKKSQEVVDLQSYYDDPEEENPLME